MNPLLLALDSPLMRALGWTLVHFLWQGACVGVVYATLRYALRSRTSTARYRLAMLCLMLLAILPIITLVNLLDAAPSAPANTLSALAPVPVQAPVTMAVPTGEDSLVAVRTVLQQLVPWTVPLWLLGVMVMALRAWRGWKQARLLRDTALFNVPPEWQAAVERLRRLLGIDKAVQLAVSLGITVPSVVGWLKPVILIPPSVLAGLTPLQMELILAHELAHIRRQDYLWNLLQILVDTLLFYHPVVRWISHHARMEREQCCDDIVVGMNGDTLSYARALTELECLRTPRSAIVLGADGGHVVQRIRRLIGMPDADISPASWGLPLLALGILIAGSLARLPFHGPLFTHQAPATADSTTYSSVQQDEVPARSNKPVSTHVKAVTPYIAMSGLIHAIPTFDPVPAIQMAAPPVPRSASPQAIMAAPVYAGGVVVQRLTPHYPQYALERGVEGSATVAFTLDAEGRITNMHVTHVHGSHLFGQAALEALRHWKFTIPTVNGVPTSRNLTQVFDFRLDSTETAEGTCRIPIGYHTCTRL